MYKDKETLKKIMSIKEGLIINLRMWNTPQETLKDRRIDLLGYYCVFYPNALKQNKTPTIAEIERAEDHLQELKDSKQPLDKAREELRVLYGAYNTFK